MRGEIDNFARGEISVNETPEWFFTPCWSFVEKTFVKQSMVLCVANFAQKRSVKWVEISQAWISLWPVTHGWSRMNSQVRLVTVSVVTRKLSSVTGHAWVVMPERPCRYKSTNLVILLCWACYSSDCVQKKTCYSYEIVKRQHLISLWQVLIHEYCSSNETRNFWDSHFATKSFFFWHVGLLCVLPTPKSAWRLHSFWQHMGTGFF